MLRYSISQITVQVMISSIPGTKGLPGIIFFQILEHYT